MVTVCFLSSESCLEGVAPHTPAVYPRRQPPAIRQPPSPAAFPAECCEGRRLVVGDCWVRGPHLGPEVFQTPSILPAHGDSQTWIIYPSFVHVSGPPSMLRACTHPRQAGMEAEELSVSPRRTSPLSRNHFTETSSTVLGSGFSWHLSES